MWEDKWGEAVQGGVRMRAAGAGAGEVRLHAGKGGAGGAPQIGGAVRWDEG